MLQRLEEANEKKDEQKFKKTIKDIKNILGQPILRVLIDADRDEEQTKEQYIETCKKVSINIKKHDEHMQYALSVMNFLLYCIENNKTYYFHLIDKSTRELSKDIATVYSMFHLFAEFNKMRIEYDFGEQAKNTIELFNQRKMSYDLSYIEEIESYFEDIILNKTSSIFENRIEFCNDMIIDLTLLEKIRVNVIQIMSCVDGLLYKVKNKAEKKWQNDVGMFYGNSLKKRAPKKYEVYKKIAITKYVGDNCFKKLKVSETDVCKYYEQDSKSFNSWKNRNYNQYWEIIDEITNEEIEQAKKEIKNIYF